MKLLPALLAPQVMGQSEGEHEQKQEQGQKGKVDNVQEESSANKLAALVPGFGDSEHEHQDEKATRTG